MSDLDASVRADPGDLLPGDLPTGIELHDDGERAATAAANLAKYQAWLRGGDARAAMLPRDDISKLGYAVANMMLRQVLTGKVKPRTTKEAMDVARLGHDLARREMGEVDIAITTPEQRANAEARLKEMFLLAQQRADQARVAEPPIEDAEVVEDTADLPELEAGAKAGAPVSAPGGAVLGRVRADRPAVKE